MRAPVTGGSREAEDDMSAARRRHGLGGVAGLAVAAALVAACGSTAVSPPSGTAAATATSTVKVGMATVSGSAEQVLTAANGFTLYYNTDDTSTTSSCAGSCASIWPALALSAGQPTASQSLPQPLTAVTDANGRQVEYAGHLLYTYAQDSAAGQANGQGKGGIWYVATPSLTAGSGATTPTPASGPTMGYSAY